jgi:hypothetical protein
MAEYVIALIKIHRNNRLNLNNRRQRSRSTKMTMICKLKSTLEGFIKVQVHTQLEVHYKIKIFSSFTKVIFKLFRISSSRRNEKVALAKNC